MVGVGRLIIIVDMAACAGIGCIGIVSVVAGSAVVGNTRMRPFQNVIIIVNGESGRLPAAGSVARRTVRWDIQGNVTWIVALVVILRMTGRTIRRRTGISRSMASEAGRRQMGAC